MRPITLLIILLLLPARAHAHPLHLSITNITYENGKLTISMKTFRDDWETAYFHYHSAIIDFTDQAQREIPWFQKYLKDMFKIAVNEQDEELVLNVQSVMTDDDAMVIEMVGELPLQPNSLYIYNAMLTDIYPDQTNLVIFGFNNRETGIKFDVMKHDAEVMLN